MATPADNTPSPDGGFGIYIHWPFCKAKCPYCDFNSHVRHARVDQKAFATAMMREMDYQHRYSAQFTVDSIFLGGGTPSLMHPETVDMLIRYIHALWDVAGDVEISLEANPTSVEADNFSAYARAGVNRVSLGVQSLIDEDLKFLGRQHTAKEAIAALDVARSTFSRVSADMIYTRPNQSPENWRRELTELLAFDLDHVSLYQLTIEPETPFHALYQAGKLHVPAEEPARQLYDLNQEICEEAGLVRYEISNHAKPGLACKHNLIYWHYGFYAGIGPGAHGRLMDDMGRFSLVNIKHPETWLERVNEKGHAVEAQEHLGMRESGDEFLLMGLRLKEGVDLSRYHALSGRMISDQKMRILMEEGLITHDQEARRLSVTSKGFPVLNQIIAELCSG